MKNKFKKSGIVAIFLSVLLVVGVMAGCSSSQTDLNPNQPAGSLLLKVNPEIRVSYDEDGQMISIEGKNAEGQQIVEQMGDFSGKPVKEIVNELVTLIYDAGYLVEEIDGDRKNIIIEIESGSHIPSEDFVEKIMIDVERLLTVKNTDTEIQIMNTSNYGDSDYSDYTDTSDYFDYSDEAGNSDNSAYSDTSDSEYDAKSSATETTANQPTAQMITRSTGANQTTSDTSDYSDYSDYTDISENTVYSDDSDYSDYGETNDAPDDYDNSDYNDSDYDDSDYSDYSETSNEMDDSDDSDYDDSENSDYSDYDS